MSGEVARIKSQIRDRKQKAMELAVEIERRIKDMKDLLGDYPLGKKLPDVRLPLVSQLASEATSLQAEYLEVLSEIKAGERELEG